MSQIVFQQVAAPNFSVANALRAQAVQSYQNGFKQLQDTLKGAQTAIRDQNTSRLMDYLNTAKTAEQFNSADFQQAFNTLKESFNGEINTKELQQRLEVLPDRLNQREMMGLQLQQSRDQLADLPLRNQIAQKLAAGDYTGAQSLMTQAKTDISPFVTMTDQLKNSAISRQNIQNSMDLDNKRFGLQQQEFIWKKQQAAQQRAILEQQLDALTRHNDTGSTGAADTSGVSSNLQALVSRVAKEQKLPENLLYAVMRQESGFNPRAVSPVGAQGLMQLMPATAASFGLKGNDVWDPYKNMTAGAKYLKQQIDSFGSVAKGLAAYNAGPGRLQEALKKGANWSLYIPNETRNYIASISKKMGYKPTQQELDAAAKQLKSAGVKYKNAPFVPLEDGNSSRPMDVRAMMGTMAANMLGNTSAGSVVDNPYGSMASLAGGDPKVFKLMSDLQRGTDKLAAEGSKEDTKLLFQNHPITQNLGKYQGSFEDWANTKGSTWLPSNERDIVSAINTNKDTKNLPDPIKTALAEAMLAQSTLAEDGWFNTGWSSADFGNKAAELLRTFTDLRDRRDQADAQVLNNEYQAGLYERQLIQNQERQKQIMELRMKLAGL